LIVAATTVSAVAALAYSKGGFDRLFENRTEVSRWILPPMAEVFLIALPATLLFLAAAIRRRSTGIAVLASMPAGIILVMAIPAGHRRYLLPLLLGLVTFVYLVRGKRPRLIPIAAAVLLLLLLVINPVRESRTGDVSYRNAAIDSIRSPHKGFESLLRDADTSMVETVALESAVLGDEVSYRYGLELVGDTLLAPIPRYFWPGKPEKMRTLLIEHLYGSTEEGAGCNVQCPVFSFFGEAAADLGIISVALISALFGLGLATGYQYLLQHRHALLAHVAYASGLWLSFQAWVAGMSIVTHSFILTVLPVALVALVARARARDR
jgi:hypothetical protein